MSSPQNILTENQQARKINNLASIENSKAFCIYPWIHLFVSHFGTVSPCCLTPWDKDQALGDINEQSVEEIWNGDRMREFRLKMLRDEQDSRCWQCYDSEKNGLRSTRNMTNFLYADKLDWVLDTAADGSSSKAKPIYWDIRISNLCNFKCRICGHHSSSQWFEDAKTLGLLSHDTKLHRGPKDFNLLMKQLAFVIPDLEEIYFAGGEPLIMEEHYRILQMLTERKKTSVHLRYATNFSQTQYKGADLFRLWAQFEDVCVYASLDGSGKRGELQRHGQNWEQAVLNRQQMLEVCPKVNFLITSTTNVFNVLHLPDFHREWTAKGLIKIDEFMPHILRHPAEYNIRILTRELKQQTEEKIKRHVDWIISYSKQNPPEPPPPQLLERLMGRLDWIKVERSTGHLKLDVIINEFRNCITYMNSSDDSHLIPQFRKMCADLDRLRGENTLEVFPELSGLLEDMKPLP